MSQPAALASCRRRGDRLARIIRGRGGDPMSSVSRGLVILHEDDHLLVCVKPAGIPTANALPGETSLYTLARGTRPFIGVVSRIDAPVSGVVVFGKTALLPRISPSSSAVARSSRSMSRSPRGGFRPPWSSGGNGRDFLPADPRVLGFGAAGRGEQGPLAGTTTRATRRISREGKRLPEPQVVRAAVRFRSWNSSPPRGGSTSSASNSPSAAAPSSATGGTEPGCRFRSVLPSMPES